MHYPFLQGLIAIPPCKSCNGTGQHEHPGFVPLTCDVCKGEGVYMGPVPLLFSAILITVSTAAPILWHYW